VSAPRLRRAGLPDTGQSRNCMGDATARLCALCHWQTRPKAVREKASVVASWSGVGGATTLGRLQRCGYVPDQPFCHELSLARSGRAEVIAHLRTAVFN
jgi:hypothetical protein